MFMLSIPMPLRSVMISVIFGGVAVGETPRDGTLMYDEVTLGLPDGTQFHTLTYNRDLERWFAKNVAWCRAKNLRWGRIDGEDLILATGERFPLSRCKVEFGGDIGESELRGGGWKEI